MKNLLIATFSILAIISCNNEEETLPATINLESSTTTLHGSILPIEIALFDDNLITVNFKHPKISLYNSTLANTANFIQNGRARNEALGGREVSISKLNRELLFTDGIGKKIMIHDLDSLTTNRSVLTKNNTVENTYKGSFLIQDESSLIKAINVKDKIIVLAPSYSEDRLFLIYDKSGNLIGKGGKYPILNNKEFNVVALTFATMDITTNEDETKFALVYECMDLIEIYNGDGILLKQVYGNDKILPDVKVTEDIKDGQKLMSVVKNKGSRAAFFRCVDKDNKLWVSYSGEVVDLGNTRVRYIHCYDWDGNLLQRYKTDKSILSFDVNVAEKNIYVITGRDNNIYKYSLD